MNTRDRFSGHGALVGVAVALLSGGCNKDFAEDVSPLRGGTPGSNGTGAASGTGGGGALSAPGGAGGAGGSPLDARGGEDGRMHVDPPSDAVDAQGGSDGDVAGPSGDALLGDAMTPAVSFECNEMIGLRVMSLWYPTFEKGVDDARWQYKFVRNGYLETWAEASSAYWKTVVNSPCTKPGVMPDRVIFLPYSMALKTQADWQSSLDKLVLAIKTNFPAVKRIELISTIRTPSNQPCANAPDPGTVVPAYVDEAIQMTADQSRGFVVVGPKVAVKDCNWWSTGTELTATGNMGVGQLYADHYKDR